MSNLWSTRAASKCLLAHHAARPINRRRVKHFTESASRFASSSSSQPTPPPSNSSGNPPNPPTRTERTWLTRSIEGSPLAVKIFLGFTRLLGYGGAKQLAGRRTQILYKELCAPRALQHKEFWTKDSDLPLTFQAWFTVTNLHVWLLTVRLRALPKGVGLHYVQGLIDHFFFDVEDGVRYILQPGVKNLRTPSAAAFVNPATRGNGIAPERLVGQQMKIFREQWGGFGLACDHGLVTSDAELAAAMWRNILGARGAQGIAYDINTPFRRSVNPYGRDDEVKVVERGLEAEESKDDLSGVHDFTPKDVDKYVKYPELMETLVLFVRKEIARLDAIPDQQLIEGDLGALHFGPISLRKP